MKSTRVVFRLWEGGVIALFPDLTGRSKDECESYMHLGQHAAATYSGIIRRSRPATPKEYRPLKRELESAPYRYKLRVMQRR